MQNALQAIIEHHRVISEARAAELVGVSPVHFRRLRQRCKGPRFVRSANAVSATGYVMSSTGSMAVSLTLPKAVRPSRRCYRCPASRL